MTVPLDVDFEAQDESPSMKSEGEVQDVRLNSKGNFVMKEKQPSGADEMRQDKTVKPRQSLSCSLT